MNDSYIAGFFDGEGSVCIITVNLGIHPMSQAGKLKFQFRPYLKFSQKHRRVLDAIRETLGYGYVCGDASAEYHGYRYFVNARPDVQDLIERMLPHSVVKRESLLLLREFVGFQTATLKNSVPYTRSDLDHMLELRDKLLGLNEVTRAKQQKRVVYTRDTILRDGFYLEDREAQRAFSARRLASTIEAIQSRRGGERYG